MLEMSGEAIEVNRHPDQKETDVWQAGRMAGLLRACPFSQEIQRQRLPFGASVPFTPTGTFVICKKTFTRPGNARIMHSC